MKVTQLILFLAIAEGCSANCNPDDFVFLRDIDPSIMQDIRYYSPHNFMGRRVEGYNAPECVLTKSAGEKLVNVQKEAMSRGYTLKVYDCYRPQRAVDDFISWSNNPMDVLMKTEFYPTIDKPDLFPDYIATKSGHSRGSTLDLTIVKNPPAPQEEYLPGQALVECFAPVETRFGDNSIDMGTGFDCLSEWANTDTTLVRYLTCIIICYASHLSYLLIPLIYTRNIHWYISLIIVFSLQRRAACQSNDSCGSNDGRGVRKLLWRMVALYTTR